jgi:hypothetical protein
VYRMTIRISRPKTPLTVDSLENFLWLLMLWSHLLEIPSLILSSFEDAVKTYDLTRWIHEASEARAREMLGTRGAAATFGAPRGEIRRRHDDGNSWTFCSH